MLPPCQCCAIGGGPISGDWELLPNTKQHLNKCDLTSAVVSLAHSAADGAPTLTGNEPNKNSNNTAFESDSNQTMLVDIRCECKINLLNAKFSITHHEQTNDFFVDLYECGQRCKDILAIIFRFPEAFPDTMEIFPSSYGRWSVGRRLTIPTTHTTTRIRILVVVHQDHYTVELGGQVIEQIQHRQSFPRCC